MAHHNRTPQTILDAPSLSVEYLVEYTNENRAQRRHYRTSTGGTQSTPKRFQAKSFNEPYVNTAKWSVMSRDVDVHVAAAD